MPKEDVTMPMSLARVREQLSAIEPADSDYEGIGASEVELLRQLLDDREPWLAARAVHALSRIDSEAAQLALLAATWSPRPEVRVAVAASAGALPPDVSDEVLSRFLNDSDVGVRKFAIRSASERNSDQIRQRIEEIAIAEGLTALRQLAEEKARFLSRP